MSDESLRLDKWLHCARFFKTRSIAASVVQAGRLRVDKTPVSKAHWLVRPGQVLTFVQGRHVRVIRVEAIPIRRGPASEAQTLYTDLAPPTRDDALPQDPATASRKPGSGRPTKKERRQIDAIRGDD